MPTLKSGGSRPSDKGGSVIQTLRLGGGGRGPGLNKFFRRFEPQFGRKIRGSAPWIRHCLNGFICLDSGLKCLFSYHLSSPRINLYSTRRRVPVNTRAIMDFNFGAAPFGVDPCVAHLSLKNTGSVPAEW